MAERRISSVFYFLAEKKFDDLSLWVGKKIARESGKIFIFLFSEVHNNFILYGK
jgi:hypothetical protein